MFVQSISVDYVYKNVLENFGLHNCIHGTNFISYLEC